MTYQHNPKLPMNRSSMVNNLKEIIETNRDRLRQIVIQAEHGEWDRESAIAEAEKLKTQAVEAARLLETILKST